MTRYLNLICSAVSSAYLTASSAGRALGKEWALVFRQDKKENKEKRERKRERGRERKTERQKKLSERERERERERGGSIKSIKPIWR